MGHGKRWLAAIRRAGKARWGRPNPAHSLRMKKKWEDADYRKRMQKRDRLHSRMMKKQWSDIGVWARRVETLNSNPTREKASRSMKGWWSTPKNYRRMLKVRKEQVTPEERIRLREMVERNWANPETRKRMVAARRTQFHDPIKRQMMATVIEAKWADPKYRNKVMATRKKTMYNPAWRKKIVAGLRRRWPEGRPPEAVWNKGLTKETDARLMTTSLRLRGQVPDYKKGWCYYLGAQGKTFMRSRWEAAFALWLDENGIEWQFEPKYFYVGPGPWVGESYLPDFYLPNQGDYVEIKGRLDEGQAKKYKKFRKLYPEVRVETFTGKQLRAAGILTLQGYIAKKYQSRIVDYKTGLRLDAYYQRKWEDRQGLPKAA